MSDIAITGIACRFPGTSNTDELWRQLSEGVESIRTFTDEDLLLAGVERAMIAHPRYVKARGIIEDLDLFDAEFFGIIGGNAERTDPQHRMLLECSWEALEDAGCDPSRAPGRTGVFLGVGFNAYRFLLLDVYRGCAAHGLFDHELMMGNESEYAPMRVAMKLGLKGPAVNVQSACCTSLVAVHLARESLLHGECDMALVGACGLRTLRREGYLYEEGAYWSPDGHCRAFDAKGLGMVPSAGAAVIVLRRLKDALADGDNIHAVIKGSAINTEAFTPDGFPVSSIDGQAATIKRALESGSIDPRTVRFIELHGTGTNLGDLKEVSALRQTYGAGGGSRGQFGLGAVKSNLGHADVASGMAGLIKSVLSLRHKTLVATLHFKEPKPALDLANSPFYVQARQEDWPAKGGPRRAGVHSLGGSTCAHVILEEAPAAAPSSASSEPQLLPLSAKTPSALNAITRRLAAHLRERSGLNLEDVAHTLQAGRKAFRHRRIVLCRTVEDAASTLALMVDSAPAAAGFDVASEPRSGAAQMWMSGRAVDWSSLRGSRRPKKVPLPTYPFERKRYWPEP